MPEVELRYQISGARDGVPYPAPGTVLDVSDDEAEQLVRIGAARYPVETADAPAVETADAPVVGLTTATTPTGIVETATA